MSLAICFSEFSMRYLLLLIFPTRDVPNLKALADVMNAEYSRDEHGMIIKATMDQISNYFESRAGG
jgi:hypothetical protein